MNVRIVPRSQPQRQDLYVCARLYSDGKQLRLFPSQFMDRPGSWIGVPLSDIAEILLENDGESGATTSDGPDVCVVTYNGALTIIPTDFAIGKLVDDYLRAGFAAEPHARYIVWNYAVRECWKNADGTYGVRL